MAVGLREDRVNVRTIRPAGKAWIQRAWKKVLGAKRLSADCHGDEKRRPKRQSKTPCPTSRLDECFAYSRTVHLVLLKKAQKCFLNFSVSIASAQLLHGPASPAGIDTLTTARALVRQGTALTPERAHVSLQS